MAIYLVELQSLLDENQYMYHDGIHLCIKTVVHHNTVKGKDKAVPLQAWSGPVGSRKLRFMTTAQDGGKVVSLTHRPPLSPGNTPGTHFC